MQNTNVAFTADGKVHLSPETITEARAVAFRHGWPNPDSIESEMAVEVYEMLREFLRQNGDSDLPGPESIEYDDIGTVRLDRLQDSLLDEDSGFDYDDDNDDEDE